MGDVGYVYAGSRQFLGINRSRLQNPGFPSEYSRHLPTVPGESTVSPCFKSVEGRLFSISLFHKLHFMKSRFL